MHPRTALIMITINVKRRQYWTQLEIKSYHHASLISKAYHLSLLLLITNKNDTCNTCEPKNSKIFSKANSAFFTTCYVLHTDVLTLYTVCILNACLCFTVFYIVKIERNQIIILMIISLQSLLLLYWIEWSWWLTVWAAGCKTAYY